MVQLLTVSTSWFAFLSARSLEWATVYVLDLGFFEARCLHLPYNEEVMFAQAAFWTGFSVKLVTDISRVRKEPCFRALYLVTRSVIVSIPLPGYLWRKDVLLFRFMKWQERPWGKNKQCALFPSQKFGLAFWESSMLEFLHEKGSCDKSQDRGMHWWGPSRAR